MICGVTGEHWRSLHEANLVKKAVQKRDARIAELEARLEITPDCQYDGIDTRDATIKELEAQLAAERERCAMICDAIEERYQQSESQMYAELRTDAQSGAAECAYAIRNGETK